MHLCLKDALGQEGEETRGGAPEGVQSSPTNEDLLPPADGLVVEQPNADPSMANVGILMLNIATIFCALIVLFLRL